MSKPKDQGGFGFHEPAKPRGALLPAATVEWSTPSWLFRQLDDEFHFTVDVAAAADNAKCERFYTKEQNGLEQSWFGERVWCNPPYDHKSLTAFGGAGTAPMPVCVVIISARHGPRMTTLRRAQTSMLELTEADE